MAGFSLEGLIGGAAERMTLDLRQRLTRHPGELGMGREAIVRSFLRAHLPERFEISSGFVFDCHGAVSKQIDIVIADSAVCAKFEVAGGTRYFPCESVLAVGEVKSSVDNEKTLHAALNNLESVKALDRSAEGQATDLRFEECIDHRNNHLHQVFSFLLVTGKALSADMVQLRVLDYVLEREPHLWPNVMLALDNYLVTYCCDHGVCPNPMDARGVAIQKFETSPDLVMRFFLLLGRALAVTRVSGLPYWQYLHSAADWSGDVIHSTTDHPPPYLSSLVR